MLEIGPFDAPFITGERVSYSDILDQAGLQKRARELGRNPDTCPHIEFTNGLRAIDRKFDSVFSAHVIEHSPDLVGHLKEVAALLEPGGSYFLIVPDKRYCFDHFLPETTFAQVWSGQGRTQPTIDAMRDHLTKSAHNRALLHWFGLHGKPQRLDRAESELPAAERGEYIDVHQWQFTPVGFQQIVKGLAIFREVKVFDTRFGDFEFAAVLTV